MDKERVWLFTSESVTEGHPDKMCDQISDAILDEILRQDPVARVAVETAITTGLVLVMGEITTSAYVDIQKIVRNTIKEIGYDRGKYGFDAETCGIIVALDEQSPDIAMGVDRAKEHKELSNDELDLIGAGDQGCIGKGELVHTDRGFVKIENVVKGDKVLTRKGFKNVLVSKKTGELPVIILKTNLGRELKLTEDHLVYTEKGWVEAKDTMGLFITKAPQMEYDGKKFEELMQEENYTGCRLNGQGSKIGLTEELAYLMGFLIGDGCINGDKGVNFAFKQKDKFDLIEPLVKKVFTDGKPTVNESGVIVHGKLYRKALYDLGLDYWKSETKEVPYTILESNKDIQCEFIKGYMDADGGIVVTRTKGRNKDSCKINVGSTSIVLLNQIRIMLNNLGIDCFIGVNALSGLTSSTGITNKFTSYRLNVRGSDSVKNYASKIGFDLKNKKEKMNKFMETYDSNKNANSDEYITQITRGKLDSVYDLEVEEEHEFFANGILVHNCVFGYASNETEEYMPLPIILAHKLSKRLTEVRKNGTLKYLRPDGKSQVTIEYLGNKPVRVDTVLVSAQHSPEVALEQLREDIEKYVIRQVIDEKLIDEKTKIYINPTGRFVVGGPLGDSGLCGRKIIVDTYGGMGRHGGGAFSSKDPTKVDRSGAYAARHVAKNVVAAGLADKCEIQLSYAIGIAKPLSVFVDTFGTGKISESEIEQLIEQNFDLRPAAIIRDLDLQRPIYKQTAAYGHFGRGDLDLPWERLDKVDVLKEGLEKELKKKARFGVDGNGDTIYHIICKDCGEWDAGLPGRPCFLCGSTNTEIKYN